MTITPGLDGTRVDRRCWPAVVLDPADDTTEAVLRELRDRGAVWAVDDTLEDQLADLARTRTRNPLLAGGDMDAAVERLLDGVPVERFGRWVLYPWSGRLVRLLPPELHRELRGDRNRHKITDAEQDTLRDLTVGIVGLSVGNAIALTLALEGSFGTLKLADHDRLDLSNLNRLRAGVHDIGVGKAELAARQIAEIDPYADVRIYREGITPDNVDEFLAGDRRVDVLIEECDAFEIKLLVRERARALRIPVLMETSDRGMLDVERYDLEPDRPIFHGLMGGLTSAGLAELGFEEQMAAGLKVIAPEELSARMLASMVERGQSVSTWPQLAAEVTLGGATVATAVRRLALGRPLASGRLRIDLDTLLGGDAEAATPATTPAPVGAAAAAPTSAPELVRFLVEQATLAPSGGNSQPWRFHHDGDLLHVAQDATRIGTRLDGSGHASLLALGAAVENIAVAAAHRGKRALITPFPDPARPRIVATIALADAGPGEEELAASFALLARRATNRHAGTRAPVPQPDLDALVAAAGSRGAHLQLHTDDAALQEASSILGEADRIRLLCPDLHRDAMAELRRDGQDASTGIDVASLELSPIEETLFGIAARADVASVLRAVGGGAAIQVGAWKAMAGAGAVGALRLPGPTPEDWLRGGRAMQRVWLAATARGLAFQPMSALVFMLELPDAEAVFTAGERDRLATLGARVDRLFGERPEQPLALVFRLAYAPAPTTSSRRLAVEQVLEAGLPPEQAAGGPDLLSTTAWED